MQKDQEAEEVDWIAHTGEEIPRTVDVGTSLEIFWKTQTWVCFSEVSKYKDFWSMSIQTKGILL